MTSISPSEIQQAVDALRRGGIIVFPTETAYGLGADARSTRALKKINALKGRSPEKTPPLIVASFAMAERYGLFSAALRGLCKQFWPGPLTLVVPARKGTDLSRSAIHRDGTIALRVSSHPVSQMLSRRLKAPIVATSANRSGEPPCYDVDCLREIFLSGKEPSVILDGGKLRGEKPSTIVKEEDGKIIVLRQGAIRIPKMYVA